MEKYVVFFAPGNFHILTGCPSDLVRFEGVFDTFMFARLFSIHCDNRYAWKNPSGHPAILYKICSLSQWENWLSVSEQLSLF